MVDWDRVEQLHNKGQSWEEIAADPKVGFHPDQSVSQAGPALRRLYYRRKSREERQPTEAPKVKRLDPDADKRWSLARIGYLIVPLAAIWFVLAFFFPSPVGLIIAAIPWIAIILAVGVFILAFGLLRSTRRWSKVFRSTLVMGVVLGLVFTGLISLTAVLIGCPFLPSSTALSGTAGPGWSATPSYVGAWTENGMPATFYYGATWCPYCSASSWAMWKALTEFQTAFGGTTSGIPGTSLGYSSSSDVYPSTPEIVLANAQVNSVVTSFVIAYDTSGVEGQFPATANCVQQAYVSAYSGSSIPFAAVDGRYIHGGSTIVNPCILQSYSGTQAQAVANAVLQETGTPWTGGICSGSSSSVPGINVQAGWITAFIVRSAGFTTVSSFLTAYPALSNPGKYQWTTSMQNLVNTDLAQIS